MSRAFINLIKKDDLCNALKELGLEYDGSVNKIRVGLRKYLDVDNRPPDHELFTQNLSSLHEVTTPGKELRMPNRSISRSSSLKPAGKEGDHDPICTSDVCDKLCKWGVEYDGGKEPLCFLQKNRIELSKSPYSSPRSKEKQRMEIVCRFSQINENSIRDAYSIPQIIAILKRLRDSKCFSSIDLKNGYWQIPIATDSKIYTAFTVPGCGLFQWRVIRLASIKHQRHFSKY